jgi:surfeit locus 1 family protein
VALIRLRQALIVAVGLVLAAGMVLLGLWQLDVYHSQGRAASERRAAEPAVEVGAVARAGQPVPDGYGRTVTFRGTYLPDEQVLVPLADRSGAFRVVAAVRLEDGDVLPVVRGVVTSDAVPAAPAGLQSGSGLLLPSEESPPGTLPAGQLSSVRLPTLAQTWPGPLVSGFVTLSGTDAAAQGLEPATVVLPESGGRLRNGAYALQWWVFAAFAVGLAVRMARDQELGEGSSEENGVQQDAVGDLTAEEPVDAT